MLGVGGYCKSHRTIWSNDTLPGHGAKEFSPPTLNLFRTSNVFDILLLQLKTFKSTSWLQWFATSLQFHKGIQFPPNKSEFATFTRLGLNMSHSVSLNWIASTWMQPRPICCGSDLWFANFRLRKKTKHPLMKQFFWSSLLVSLGGKSHQKSSK